MRLSILFLASLAVTGVTHAEETIIDKADSTARTVRRTINKHVHRAQEATCRDGKVKCFGKKMEHRASEAGELIEDKAVEIKNKVD